MPNWCNNGLRLRHNDAGMIARAQTALSEGRFFSEFLPVPDELQNTTAPNRDALDANALMEKYGAKDWYDWSVKNWGTKWDTESFSVEVTENGHFLETSFDTAWAPPVEFYKFMESIGFEVEAFYWESGMCFCGMYSNGEDDYFEYSDDSIEDMEDYLPDELNEYFDLTNTLADWRAQDEDYLDSDAHLNDLD